MSHFTVTYFFVNAMCCIIGAFITGAHYLMLKVNVWNALPADNKQPVYHDLFGTLQTSSLQLPFVRYVIHYAFTFIMTISLIFMQNNIARSPRLRVFSLHINSYI